MTTTSHTLEPGQHARPVWRRLALHYVEMVLAMYVQAVLVSLVWADVVSAMAFMTAAHGLMLAAMLAVLLRHRNDYTQEPS